MTLTEMRKDILRLAFKTQEGHIAASFSCLEILWALYDRVMAQNVPKEIAQLRDRVILSKGHAAIGYYTVLAAKGFISRDELQTFCAQGSRLEGHPNLQIPGVEVSTGSLGHGLPMAVGIALALRLKKSDARVFCIVGDGECMEGAVWEAAILAPHLKLNNLTLIVDANRSSPVRFPLGDKFQMFGWTPRNVHGHDIGMLVEALRPSEIDAPLAVIAHTTKGYGCRPVEANPEMWHHRSPQSQDELETMIALCK